MLERKSYKTIVQKYNKVKYFIRFKINWKKKMIGKPSPLMYELVNIIDVNWRFDKFPLLDAQLRIFLKSWVISGQWSRHICGSKIFIAYFGNSYFFGI